MFLQRCWGSDDLAAASPSAQQCHQREWTFRGPLALRIPHVYLKKVLVVPVGSLSHQWS